MMLQADSDKNQTRKTEKRTTPPHHIENTLEIDMHCDFLRSFSTGTTTRKQKHLFQKKNHHCFVPTYK